MSEAKQDALAGAIVVVLLCLFGWASSGCAQLPSVLSAAELAAKIGCSTLCPMVTEGGEETP